MVVTKRSKVKVLHAPERGLRHLHVCEGARRLTQRLHALHQLDPGGAGVGSGARVGLGAGLLRQQQQRRERRTEQP